VRFEIDFEVVYKGTMTVNIETDDMDVAEHVVGLELKKGLLTSSYVAQFTTSSTFKVTGRHAPMKPKLHIATGMPEGGR
jgi:hypothetical protein